MEKIYTIPVNEAFEASAADPACGCPFCTLYRKLELSAARPAATTPETSFLKKNPRIPSRPSVAAETCICTQIPENPAANVVSGMATGSPNPEASRAALVISQNETATAAASRPAPSVSTADMTSERTVKKTTKAQIFSIVPQAFTTAPHSSFAAFPGVMRSRVVFCSVVDGDSPRLAAMRPDTAPTSTDDTIQQSQTSRPSEALS